VSQLLGLLLLQWHPQVHVQQQYLVAPPAAHLVLLACLQQELLLEPQHLQLAVRQT
jgi:hypothetical protein